MNLIRIKKARGNQIMIFTGYFLMLSLPQDKLAYTKSPEAIICLQELGIPSLDYPAMDITVQHKAHGKNKRW